MSFSYNADLTRQQDQVRFLLQDTTDSTTKPKQLDDGEIRWALKTEANVYTAAAMCADILATRARGLASKTVGGLSLTYSRETWASIAKSLRLRGSTHQVISSGGITVTDRDAIWEDTDILRPSFFSELHQDPKEIAASPPLNEQEEP